MENMAMKSLFGGKYRKKKVLITGHTGFKGSWLALWLSKMGADITGYALNPSTEPNHFDLLDIKINSIIGDIRNLEELKQVFRDQQPEIVFHLAAQPIVRLSYDDPITTFSSNVMGTINVFEAAREVGTVKAILNVTSDKCYENKEWVWGYRETDPMGGFDPYSASKGCAELITNCWRNSFFCIKDNNLRHQTHVSSCRAGNVIGGGDWGVDRLIPDIIRSAFLNKDIMIRNPNAIRPWQHVLDPLSGYLFLGQKLLEGNETFSEAWNFGPSNEDASVEIDEIVTIAKRFLPEINVAMKAAPKQPHEANILKLDCSKARLKLQWTPVWDINVAIEKTLTWYRLFYENNKVCSQEDISQYVKDAKIKQIPWTE
jgi:CDP-glucose 4,6-dehydratase